MDGPQGGIGTALTVDTDLSLSQQTRFDDDPTPGTTQCTGDAEAVGEAGAVFGALACTDPGMLPGAPGCTHHFRTTSATVIAPAVDDGGALVQRLTLDARTPLAVTASPFG